MMLAAAFGIPLVTALVVVCTLIYRQQGIGEHYSAIREAEADIDYGVMLSELSFKTGTKVHGVRQHGLNAAEIQFSYLGKQAIVVAEVGHGVIFWKRSDLLPMSIAIVQEAIRMAEL